MNDNFTPKGWTTVIKRNKITGQESIVLNKPNRTTFNFPWALSMVLAGTPNVAWGDAKNNPWLKDRGLRLDGIAWGSIGTTGGLVQSVTGSYAGTFHFGTNSNYSYVFDSAYLTANFIATCTATFNFDSVATINYLSIGAGSCWQVYYSNGWLPECSFAVQLLVGTNSLVYSSLDQMIVKWYLTLFVGSTSF